MSGLIYSFQVFGETQPKFHPDEIQPDKKSAQLNDSCKS